MYLSLRNITSKYSTEEKRASVKRTKSLFPDKHRWHPEGRLLSASERQLLVGPQPEVTFLSEFAVEDKKTIIYSPFDDKKLSKVSNSFVQLVHERTVTFGSSGVARGARAPPLLRQSALAYTSYHSLSPRPPFFFTVSSHRKKAYTSVIK